jgi:hypothetical protein
MYFMISAPISHLTLVTVDTVGKDTPPSSTSVEAAKAQSVSATSGSMPENGMNFFSCDHLLFDIPLIPVTKTLTTEVTAIPSVSATEDVAPVAAQSESAGRWYAVTVGKNVGVFTDWLVLNIFHYFFH